MPDEKLTREDIEDATAALAAKGIIYDSGERRNGRIVWKPNPRYASAEEAARAAGLPDDDTDPPEAA